MRVNGLENNTELIHGVSTPCEEWSPPETDVLC